MTRPRVGIVGARRARQGLGPYVARELRAAGADVVAFSCTGNASVAEAAATLAGLGIGEARGYAALDAMLAREALDALAILSPVESHARGLEVALEAGLHTLCEKPLLWDGTGSARSVHGLADAFAARGLLLMENCQWPYVLPSFGCLHPGALARAPRRFSMRLSPSGDGVRMLVDVLPHPLSLLQALTGYEAPRIDALRFSTRDPEAPRLRLGFVYAAASAEVEVEIELVGRSAPPRNAWLSLDGRQARRIVGARGDAFALEDAGREVALPDPLAGLVADFVMAVARCREGEHPGRADAVATRMEALCAIVGAFETGKRP